MSLENEDPRSLDTGSENSDVILTKKKCYSREFLLSLSNLDICKKLPSGVDESLRSDFEDASLRTSGRPRFPGSLPLQGFRRNDYGSSPPIRADSGCYSRGTYGKWERTSSGQSEQDSNSQSATLDSGRRYNHQSRRTWQSPEHDGLLGSGSFPRPHGFSTGTSAPKVIANEHNQLTRGNEPYHPPRPYKATPYSRRDTDSYNDETFGSIDSTSKDRAEEERRRASFEMMRKEQQRALQEKQKLNLEKHRAGNISDLSEVLVDRKEDKGPLIRNNELVGSAASDSEKPSSASQSPAWRPLVPPGFKSNSVEKSLGLKRQMHPTLTEVESLGKTVIGDGLRDAEANIGGNATGGLEKQQSKEIGVVEGQPADKTQQALLLNQGENVHMHGSFDVPPIKKPSLGDPLSRLSIHLDSLATHNDAGIPEFNAEILEDKTVLEKIFGSTLSLNDDQSSLAENLDSKPDDSWLPNLAQSSKFAHWFFEEEAKVADEASSARPDNLLSLISSGDKVNGESGEVRVNKKDEALPTVLTCEDLEQSILSEYSSNTTKVQAILQSGSPAEANTEQSSAHVDDHASLHLLSMLQKNAEHSNMAINSGVDTNSANKGLDPGEYDMTSAVNEPEGHGNSRILPNLGKMLTLETLFGTAFMKELQSADAPVSVKRGSKDSPLVDASEPPGLVFPVSDNGISFPTDKSGLQRSNHEYSMPSNNRQHIKLNEADNWVVVDGTSPPNLHTTAVLRHGRSDDFDDFQLPEESLIFLRDTNASQMPTCNAMYDSHPSLDIPINIEGKLAALVPHKDNWEMGGSDILPLPCDSYKQMEPEIPYQNLPVQQSSSVFKSPEMPQLSPFYPHLEQHNSHLASQISIFTPETIFNHDSLPNQQFSSSTIQPPFPHSNVRVPGYDVPSQYSLLHQLQMPGNRPLHMLPDFPRGGPVPRHVNQAIGTIQEVNQMQGFPCGPHQPNIGGRGIRMPGKPPEAFQRLMEMELQAKSKQIHSFGPSHSQGLYGHEVDMGFQYR